MSNDESCVEMVMSNTAIGVLGGSIVGFGKASYYMGPRVPSSPIQTPISSAQAVRIMGNMAVHYGFLSALFTGGLCISKTIRSKDDAYNYLIGGFLAGGMIGLRRKSFHHVITMGTLLGVAAAGCYVIGDALRHDATTNEQSTALWEKNVKFYQKDSHDVVKKTGGSFY